VSARAPARASHPVRAGRAWRYVGFAALAAFAGATALLVNLIWFKPVFIRAFFDRIFIEFALDDPELLSQIRIFEPLGIRSHNAELTDVSPAREQELAAKLRSDLATLQRYDRDDLDPSQALSYDILEYFLAAQVEGERFLFHDYPVNQLSGVQDTLPEFMVETHRLADARDAEDYVARLGLFDTKFVQVLEGLRVREARGVTPPAFVVDKVLAGMRAFVATAPRENLLYMSFAARLGKVDGLAAADAEALRARVEAAVRDDVYPAYRSLIDYFEALRPRTTSDDGVWKLPDGELYYAYQLATNTTTDLAPQELHDVGLREVERIQAEMRAVLEEQGYRVTSVGESMRALAAEERFHYPDTDEGRNQILADFQAIIDEISAALDPAFSFKPRAGIVVKRIPEFREATAPGAYYNGPPRDGSAPGTFYVNLRSVPDITKYSMRTLAYHEAVPGHHFQVSAQQELEGLPIFRTFPLFTAYVEGWALYAERLAWELGFQRDPYDNLGRLQDELMRAVRLVVDTGLHAQRWTREQAIEYMAGATGLADKEVVAEIERYIVSPGQACAYKTGMLKILELRESARTRLGERFDLREFHDAVLENGAVPLVILERLVDDYVDRELAAP
jgi:uncharacterized protein (DUF885 family)